MLLIKTTILIYLILECVQCKITAEDEKNLMSSLMKVTIITLTVTQYELTKITAPEGVKCCQAYENINGFCNDKCMAEFKIMCKDTEAGSLGQIKLTTGTNKAQLKSQLNNSECFEQDKMKVILFSSSGVQLLVFQLIAVRVNQYSENQVSRLGKDSITYSMGKICHPYMGEKCNKPCVSYGPGYHCNFETGERMCRGYYQENNCELSNNPCSNNPCSNGGKCKHDDYGSPVCECVEGTFGQHCEYKVCSTINCGHGSCQKDASCLCQSGYSGVDCNEQICSVNTCFNSGSCTTTEKSAMCSCLKDTAYGLRCQNKCASKCLGDSVCTQIESTFKCFCPFGMTNNQCIDLLPKTDCNTLSCHNGGKCKQFSATEAYCECPPVFTGKDCGIPVCSLSNCIRGSCMDNGTCSCMESFTGANCDRPICISGKSCLNGGICVSSINGISCNCDRNFAGPKCQHECTEKCSENGRCEIFQGQAVCVCDQYHVDSRCETNIEKQECKNLDCKNGAQCRFVENRYQCVCSNQWTGTDCSISKCEDNNCQRGVCVDGVGCVCTTTFLGQNCSIASCAGDYCNNQGICNIYGNTQICQCFRSFYGNRCQYACNPRCVHGQCYNENGISKCRCDKKFYGTACEHENIVEFINMILLAVMIIVAAIFFLTFITALLTNLIFKRQKREKLFLKGTIQQGFEMTTANKKDLNWGALAK